MDWMRLCFFGMLMICTSASLGAENNSVLRLQCTWSSSLDTETMKMSPTAGSKMITVAVGPDKSGRLRKEGLGAEFTAAVTDEEIDAKTEYEIGQLRYRERIKINRYTGAIENWVLIGKEGLVHYGTCKQLPNRLF
jgi:hypothetical protein